MTFNYPKSIPESLLYAADSLGVNLPQLARVDGVINRLIEKGEHKFIGLRVLRRGQLIFSGEYGTTRMGDDAIPLPSDAIYPLASITKVFTAACIMILQERGEINLFDRVSDWFPEFTGEGKEYVNLWHLMCHSSGMDEDAAAEWIVTRIEELTGKMLPTWAENPVLRRDMLLSVAKAVELSPLDADAGDEEKWGFASEIETRLLRMAPLKNPIHSQFSYYSMGFFMQKELVERITGQTLEQFAYENIFAPLGMDDTHWVLPLDKYDRRVIKDPTHKGGEWLNSEETAQSTGGGGGLKSTLDDMLLFGQMFLQGGTLNGARILSPATVRLMTTDMNADLPDSFWFSRMLGANWGLGWDVKNGKKDDLGMLRGELSYNHGGYGGARLLIDPDAEVVAAYYMCEKADESVYDNMRNVNDTLFAAFD